MNKPLCRTLDVLVRENIIVKHRGGSHAYGTALATSDMDYRGIFVCDPINLLTPFFPVREYAIPNEEDTKLYELSHFVKLASECNPNIIETLWIDDADIVIRTPAYQFLRSRRTDFLSRRIAHTTCGYALSQLKRIKGHNKWINNPWPSEPPRQSDYLSLVQNFMDEKMLKLDVNRFRENHRLIPFGDDIYGVYTAWGYALYSDDYTLNINFDEQDRPYYKTPLFIVKFNRGNYQQAKENHAAYWTWKRNRSEVRSALEKEFGYDTKHAMHLVRLLRMGKEALETGKVLIKRPDAEELLSIRAGAWTYAECMEYAEDMHALIQNLCKKTELPDSPNIHKISSMLMEIQQLVWKH